MGFLLDGMKEEIPMEVTAFEPPNRHRMISVARSVERKLDRVAQSSGCRNSNQYRRPPTIAANSSGGGGRNQAHSSSSSVNGPSDRGPKHPSQTQPRGGTRNLTYQELMDRMSKGLCFKCGQYWSQSHICPDKHLRLFILDGEETPENEEKTSEEEGGEMSCQTLDYRALDSKELARSKTIKLEGALNGYSIVLLVDSGASHNFVARELLNSLGMTVSDTEVFSIGLGNGSKCSS